MCEDLPQLEFHRRCRASPHSSGERWEEAVDRCCGSCRWEPAPCHVGTAERVPLPYRSPVAASRCIHHQNISNLFLVCFPVGLARCSQASLHLTLEPQSEPELRLHIRESHEQ